MRRFFPYFRLFKPVRWQLASGILCGLMYGAANGAGLPLMIKKVFPTIFGAGAADLPAWKIAAAALWLPLIFTIRGVTGYLNTYLIQYAGVRVLEALRLDFFRKLQALPLEFFGRNSTGDIISRGLGDTNQLQNTLTVVANEVIKQPATLIGAVSYLGYLAFHERGILLSLLCLGVIPLSVFPIRYVGRKMQEKRSSCRVRRDRSRTGSPRTCRHCARSGPMAWRTWRSPASGRSATPWSRHSSRSRSTRRC